MKATPLCCPGCQVRMRLEAFVEQAEIINKIDTNSADTQRTITSLIENSIFVEGHGGNIPYQTMKLRSNKK